MNRSTIKRGLIGCSNSINIYCYSNKKLISNFGSDGYESHESAAFQDYFKSHNIITISLPPHSSYLTQPFNIGCFSVLKRAYSHQIEDLIKMHINHITKIKLFRLSRRCISSNHAPKRKSWFPWSWPSALRPSSGDLKARRQVTNSNTN